MQRSDLKAMRNKHIMKKLLFAFSVLILVFSAAAELTVDFKINKSEPFYKVGEKIVVSTEDNSYVERAK